MMRLSASTVAICSAVRGVRNQAYGFAAATDEKRAYSSPRNRRCSPGVRLARARFAFSNSG